VVVVAAGAGAFVWCKRDVDRRRLVDLKAEQKTQREQKKLAMANNENRT